MPREIQENLRHRILKNGALCTAIIVAFSLPFVLHAQRPNESLVITSITRSLGKDASIYVAGQGPTSVRVDIDLISDEEGLVFKDAVTTSATGAWSITIPDASFPSGAYTLRATSVDSFGKVTAASETRGFKVKPQQLVTVGSVEFGWIDAIVFLILGTIAVIGLIGWYFEHARRKYDAYIASRSGTLVSVK